ncbi:MAG: hypothetical protein KDK99_05285 [Verrucomicrobiales bacterium]|nr:hypothetical protein [Verrucomicrobiales bacterium]
MNAAERRIVAAQGYVELHLPELAREELAALPADMLDRADVTELLTLCLMAEQRWADALPFAHQLCLRAPDQVGGFIHGAYCLHELGRTQEALELLEGGPDALRGKAVYFYNLGCYLACLGQQEKALRLLCRSFDMDPGLRLEARRDPDLSPLRAALASL